MNSLFRQNFHRKPEGVFLFWLKATSQRVLCAAFSSPSPLEGTGGTSVMS